MTMSLAQNSISGHTWNRFVEYTAEAKARVLGYYEVSVVRDSEIVIGVGKVSARLLLSIPFSPPLGFFVPPHGDWSFCHFYGLGEIHSHSPLSWGSIIKMKIWKILHSGNLETLTVLASLRTWDDRRIKVSLGLWLLYIVRCQGGDRKWSWDEIHTPHRLMSLPVWSQGELRPGTKPRLSWEG